MKNTTRAKQKELEKYLAEIQFDLKEVRQDVSQILQTVQDELEAFREREFWRDYSDSYEQD